MKKGKLKTKRDHHQHKLWNLAVVSCDNLDRDGCDGDVAGVGGCVGAGGPLLPLHLHPLLLQPAVLLQAAGGPASHSRVQWGAHAGISIISTYHIYDINLISIISTFDIFHIDLWYNIYHIYL